MGGEQEVKVVVPDGSDERRRPLLVFLHGRDGDESSSIGQPMLDALESLGGRAPIVAFPDGGGDSYWHDRASGAWGRYVTEEVVPEISDRFDADPDRVAIGGISMGGFGALDLARLHPGRFCAAGAHSPALWQSGAETAAGAFDDVTDFERHDVIGAASADPEAFSAQELWLDAGSRDPFRPGDDAFVAALGAAGVPITAHTWPGGHDAEYWDRHWDRYMRFYARALDRC